MKEENTTPLRKRMIEDMRIRDIKETTQKGHIRAVKNFAAFLGRSPDTATPNELRAYQLHMTDTGVSTATFNTRIVSLRLFFGTNLRARRDEALHAVPPQTKEAARCVQR
jgi:integrase/recombinase XerD